MYRGYVRYNDRGIMIHLLEDRRSYSTNKMGVRGNEVFLKAGCYDRIRIVPGLGWLVAAGYTGKTSIIRFKDGVEE